MAVLEIVSNITSSLTNAISYIQNKEKTTDTDGDRLITTNIGVKNFSAEKEAQAMEENLMLNRRRSKRMAQHLVQSFDDKDRSLLTPEQIHELGVMIAEEITGGNSLFIVATHVSQARIHNHIIICNHDQATGRAHQWGPRDLQKWREYNDTICKKKGLTILPAPKIGRQIPTNPNTRLRVGGMYAQATGASWVEDLKNRIDMAGAMASTYKEFRGQLHQYGISIIPRGKHFTYMLTADGTKIRDTRLGEAYNPANVYGRISKRPVTEISFSKTLIVRRKGQKITLMIPGTHGDKRITIPEEQTLQTGPNSWHAWIPQDRPLTLTDRRGCLAGRITARDLTNSFIQPGSNIEREYRALSPRISTAAQRQANKAYIWQARQIARTRQEIDALRIVETTSPSRSVDQAIRRLAARASDVRSSLAAQVAALANARHEGQTDPTSAETPQMMGLRTEQIRQLKNRIRDLTLQIRTVETVKNRQQEQAETEQKEDSRWVPKI